MSKPIVIDTDLGVEYRDSGPWRSYQVTAQGETLDELRDSLTVSEVDQDGGEIDCYGIDDLPNGSVEAAVEKLLADVALKAGLK